MGYDLFDSASYALFAKDERYLTSRGTYSLKDLQYLPCSCPVCRKYNPQELRSLPKGRRHLMIAEHNMHVIVAEIETIKQAIKDGNLWDLLETRAKGHPQMTSALKTLTKYGKYLEEGSSGFKGKGVFYYDYHSLGKPEVIRYHKRLLNNYRKPISKDIQILLTTPNRKPFNKNQGFTTLKKSIAEFNDKIHYCFIAAPYGLIPENLAETYPTSQYLIAEPLDYETIQYTVNNILEYIETHSMKYIVIVHKGTELEKALIRRMKGKYTALLIDELGETKTSKRLLTIIKEFLRS
jgi:7-cyano-7-deazaguanine tRNA-ribosyltransferase